MLFQYNDGGREEAGFKGTAGDCVVRAIAIVANKPYIEVYNEINLLAKDERVTKRRKCKSSSRNGVFKKTYHNYILSLGFKWIPLMKVGVGCKVHLKDGEIPMGRLIVRLSKHLTSVIDGVINDTFNPQRKTILIDGYGNKKVVERCVYGYYTR